jgi:GGDEF domain-containing protein
MIKVKNIPEYSDNENPVRLYLMGEQGGLFHHVSQTLMNIPGLSVVCSSNGLDCDEMAKAEFCLIAAENETVIHRHLDDLRSDSEFCLSPIILLVSEKPNNGTSFPYFDHLIICPVSEFAIRKAINRSGQILTRVRNLSPLPEGLDERSLRQIQLLRFFFSREVTEISCQLDPASPVGYSLPWADDILGVGRGQSLAELNRLAAEGLLFAEPQDSVNLCPHCNDYYINFREVCPCCASPEIARVKTIQHFTCAYSGPETNFIKDGKYICPKCDRVLKHIGVDYAKPGEVVICRRCGQTSQESEINCLSLTCGAVFPPHQTIPFPINRYRLTAKGKEAAFRGYFASNGYGNVLQSFLNIYQYPFFEKCAAMEIKRSLRYKRPFCLIRLKITNLEDIEAQIGYQQKVSLIKELMVLCASETRETDLIVLCPDDDILLLLIETDEEPAVRVLNRIASKSQEVFNPVPDFMYYLASVPHQANDYGQLREMLSLP